MKEAKSVSQEPTRVSLVGGVSGANRIMGTIR
jgi:hypothetical protein